MVNRLDRIVPFAPLGPDAIRRIAAREWGKVLARDGVRFRGVAATADDGLPDRLAAVGFDAKYGARPLKRAMERELLAPLARQMNRHAGDVPLAAHVGIADGEFGVTVRPVQGAKPRSGEPTGPAGRLAAAAQDLRRWHQLLERSSVVRELENEVYQLGEQEKYILARQKQSKPLRPGDPEALAKLGRLREVAGEMHRHRAAALALEDEAVVGFHTDGDAPAAGLAARHAELSGSWDDLLFRLYAANRPGADRVTLALFSEHRGHLVEMAEAYRGNAKTHRLAQAAHAYRPLTADEARRKEQAFNPNRPLDEYDDTFWEGDALFSKNGSSAKAVLERTRLRWDDGDGIAEGAIGLGLSFTGPAADIRFSAEAGLHKFVGTPADEGNPDVLVAVTGEPLDEYRPPAGMVRRGAIKAEAPRRVYDRGNGTVVDRELDEAFTGLWGSLAAVLEPVLAAAVRHRLRQVVLE